MLPLVIASFMLALILLTAALLESLGRWVSERRARGRVGPAAFEDKDRFRLVPRPSPTQSR